MRKDKSQRKEKDVGGDWRQVIVQTDMNVSKGRSAHYWCQRARRNECCTLLMCLLSDIQESLIQICVVGGKHECMWILGHLFIEDTCLDNFKVNNHDFYNSGSINGVDNWFHSQL